MRHILRNMSFGGARCSNALIIAVILAGAASLTGCGYHAGFLIPADVHTIHIRMAQNQTFWHEAQKSDNLDTAAPLPGPRPAFTMEVDFTDRLKNEVVRRTPLRVADEEKADTVLVTSISKLDAPVLLRDAQDNVVAQRVRIAVDFTWRDRRSGRVLAQGQSVMRPTDFITVRGETFTTASRESFDYIAQRIVELMQEGF